MAKPKSKHDVLADAATAAITAVFSDTSVGRDSTRSSLQELREEINMHLDALDEDDRREARGG